MTGCHYTGQTPECSCICHKPSGKVKCLLCKCREETEYSKLKIKVNEMFAEMKCQYAYMHGILDAYEQRMEELRIKIESLSGKLQKLQNLEKSYILTCLEKSYILTCSKCKEEINGLEL